jgi:hypothetical protein
MRKKICSYPPLEKMSGDAVYLKTTDDARRNIDTIKLELCFS